MRYVVAVSGGVDSVVLLDMLAKEGVHELIVAHFDHGIREDSTQDAYFVEQVAKKWRLPYEMKREELGRTASEEFARSRRYAFLYGVAEKYKATIVTAHHMNDVAETIAINITRGTGWRGVAVLASGVRRPLLGMTKAEIVAYAAANNLDWREDSTNASDIYLRNRIRPRFTNEDTVLQLAALRARQVEIRGAVDELIKAQLDSMEGAYSRYFFTHIDPTVATELLRAIAIEKLGHSLVRPQLERSLLAIKTARSGSRFPFGRAEMIIDKTFFVLSVKTP